MERFRHKASISLSLTRLVFNASCVLLLTACCASRLAQGQTTHWQGTSSADDSGWQVISVQRSDKAAIAASADNSVTDAARAIVHRPSQIATHFLIPASGNDIKRIQKTEKTDTEPADSRVQAPVHSSTIIVDREDTETPIEADRAFYNPETVAIDLFVGEVNVLGQFKVKRVAVGNGSIINAEVLDSGELLVIASAPGSSSLRIWHKDGRQSDYNVRVSEHDPQTRVRMERMVRMRVRMVEFNKSALGRLGIDWSDSTNGPGLATVGDAIANDLFRPAAEGFDSLPNRVAPFSTYFGIASNITSRINFLAQNGDAVTLSEPVLSAMNGGKASFLAGGEVPFPTTTENGQTVVEFKEYGVKLNVAPLIDRAGNVRTQLETEISQLDTSVSVDGVPGLLTRRAQTEVTVQSGQTIVISGLLSSENGADSNMIPGLGRLPVIGRFFSSKSQNNSVRELVIFVTPEVVEADSTMITERERQYFQESEKRMARLREKLPLME